MEVDNYLIYITGLVEDFRTGEPVVDANIYLKSDRTNSTFSNEQGRFALEVLYESALNTEDILIITSSGYERYVQHIELVEGNLDVEIHLKKRINKAEHNQSDNELIEAALGGDQRAYSRLLDRYRDSLFFMIQKMVNNRTDADDLTMEAFSRAFSRLDAFNPKQAAFSTWLYTIAINRCIDFTRAKRLETFSLDAPTEDDNELRQMHSIQANMLDPEETIIRDQRIKLVSNVIGHLEVRYRKLIEMRYLHDMQYDEIAKALNMPLGTVKAQLHRAKSLLANMLQPGLDKI